MRKSPSRGWSSQSPKRGIERSRMKKKCGSKCFLRPKTNGYPICTKNCIFSCKGLSSARNRAMQYKLITVQKSAERLAKISNCSWYKTKSPKKSTKKSRAPRKSPMKTRKSPKKSPKKTRKSPKKSTRKSRAPRKSPSKSPKKTRKSPKKSTRKSRAPRKSPRKSSRKSSKKSS